MASNLCNKLPPDTFQFAPSLDPIATVWRVHPTIVATYSEYYLRYWKASYLATILAKTKRIGRLTIEGKSYRVVFYKSKYSDLTSHPSCQVGLSFRSRGAESFVLIKPEIVTTASAATLAACSRYKSVFEI